MIDPSGYAPGVATPVRVKLNGVISNKQRRLIGHVALSPRVNLSIERCNLFARTYTLIGHNAL